MRVTFSTSYRQGALAISEAALRLAQAQQQVS